MTLNNFDTLFYTFAFVVPGFVFYGVLSAFIPQKEVRTEASLLRYLVFSSVNYALWSWLIYLLHTADFFVGYPLRVAVGWGFIILLSPVILGIATVRAQQTGIITRTLQWFGFNPIHPIPTSWDYVFSGAGQLWVIVTLKDGNRVGGVFSRNSFASSDPRERDLYLENVFKVYDDKPWEHIARNRGMLIKADEIRYINFLGNEEVSNAGGHTAGASQQSGSGENHQT